MYLQWSPKYGRAGGRHLNIGEFMRTGTVYGVGCSLLLGVIATGQTPEKPPAFEVASIRPSADQPTQASVGVRISVSQARISGLTLKDYVGMAYRLPTG